jgi:hypothetical protein
MVERTVKDYIKQSDKYNIIKKYGFKEERYVKGTMRMHIDFSLKLLDRFIEIEIDPFKHKSYNKENELYRMYKIKKVNGKLTIFLRFNPNEYNDYNSKEHKSAINYKNGEWIIDKEEMDKRLNALLERIKYWMDPKNKISKIYEKLYYDHDEDENNSETDDISDDNANYVHRQTKRRKINREETKDSDEEIIDLTNDTDTENDEETNDNIFI